MYDPPAYVWAITIAGTTAIAAATCTVLYSGAVRACLGRSRAALLAGAAAVLLGGWLTATAVIASHGWYHTLPWFPVAVAGFLGTLLALSRIPVVARAVTAPDMASRLVGPHSFRVAGVVFLFYLALGHLPALFALPAGLGDIATGIAAPLVALRLTRGTGRRAAVWFNAFGLTDLAVALTLGALTGFQLLNITPSSAPITELPLALITTAIVPLLFALHITSMVTLNRPPITRPLERNGTTMTRMTPLLERNEQFARTYTPAPLGPPAAQVLIVTCLDHRVDPAIVLGLQLGDAVVIRNAGGRVTQAVIDDIAYIPYLAGQLFGRQVFADSLFEVAVVHHTQCGTGFLTDPSFRRQAAEATGIPEATLEASAVTDPHTTVKADVERLLTSPLLSPAVSVSGHVYDIATGRLTTTVDARYP